MLVPAIQLTCLDGVEQRAAAPVTYIHLMFDRHQIVLSDGAWSESFQPGDLTLAGMDQAQRDELLALFPEVAVAEGYDAARPTLSSREVRVLFFLTRARLGAPVCPSLGRVQIGQGVLSRQRYQMDLTGKGFDH